MGRSGRSRGGERGEGGAKHGDKLRVTVSECRLCLRAVSDMFPTPDDDDGGKDEDKNDEDDEKDDEKGDKSKASGRSQALSMLQRMDPCPPPCDAEFDLLA